MTKEDLVKTKIEFMSRLITIVIAGLGLIAALAWDEALKHLFKVLFPNEATFASDILYAVIITLLATIVSLYLRKLFLKKAQ